MFDININAHRYSQQDNFIHTIQEHKLRYSLHIIHINICSIPTMPL